MNFAIIKGKCNLRAQKISFLNQMKKSLLIISCLFFISIYGYAQNKLQGTIKDRNTGETLIGAAIVIKGTSIGSVTDIDGKFEFPVSQSPPFTLTISYLGYVTQEIEVKSLVEKMKIGLSTDEVIMSEVEVVGQRISEKIKESALTIESMDILAIKETPSVDFYEGLGQLKGVDLTSASIGFKVINTRGFNSTSPVRSLQLIDGIDNQSPGLNFSLGNFLGAPELDVMKVNLIVGASSAYYGPNAFNGVISMNTKNPFQFPGLDVSIKVGERNYLETAFRFAKVFKNKNEEDKLAIKFNMFFMRANDWEATNLEPTDQSEYGKSNFGGYDAVNRYGDELPKTDNINLISTRPGLGAFYRDGYEEKDLVNYNAKNIKMGLAMHYKLNEDLELIGSSNFGTGTTVYQGDNRYSLNDILFFQHRLEIKKQDKFFFRVYATHEDAGNSYDAFFTALMLQDAAKGNNPGTFYAWSTDYQDHWSEFIIQKAYQLPGFPNPYDPTYTADWFGDTHDSTEASALSILGNYPDSIMLWHQEARDFANSADPLNIETADRFEPGTARFDSAFNSITSKPLNGGGTKFVDKSALYHVHTEYKFTPEIMDITVGANYRLYTPKTEGTIFSDTGNVRITNYEYGIYAGVEKKLIDDRLKVSATTRFDKNQNFKYTMNVFKDTVQSFFAISPAASAVYTFNPNHILRLSFSSAIRNPTLSDQYLFYNVGRAILIGNLNGIDSMVTLPSMFSFLNSQDPDSLSYFNIDAVKPERVKTYELGYRATFFNKIYLDASYYFSFYRDFIGYEIGADLEYDPIYKSPTDIQVYRAATNAKDMVSTQGFSCGISYFFKKYYSLNGNYSWNKLDLRGSNDPIIPAYNTPRHKFNIGISGRDIASSNVVFQNLGFSINYKWIEGFIFEGSPQFTGYIPSYDMLDGQVSRKFPKQNLTFKLGVSNLFGLMPFFSKENSDLSFGEKLDKAFSNAQYQVYGGPRVGRLAYFSLAVSLDNKKTKQP